MTAFAEVDTATLKGEALNWAACVADGLTPHLEAPHYGNGWRVFVVRNRGASTYSERYQPESDWGQGGQLMDKHNVELMRFGEQAFYERDPYWNQKPCVGAYIREYHGCTYNEVHIEQCVTADTRLVAVCRAVVMANLGPVVSIPLELL